MKRFYLGKTEKAILFTNLRINNDNAYKPNKIFFFLVLLSKDYSPHHPLTSTFQSTLVLVSSPDAAELLLHHNGLRVTVI